ncbi:hypothetical protein CRENBAI_002413 [Crenichthys baileyi]|uniref:Uncharacterized protein n=1 Tax=Crenichthys baileyi TaxID=28760 RepID=A0AAV9RGU7_9TELE
MRWKVCEAVKYCRRMVLKFLQIGKNNSNMDEEEEAEDECWTEDSLASSSCKSLIHREQRKGYGVQNVKHFLKITKNMKNVKVEDFFPDKKQFFMYVRKVEI